MGFFRKKKDATTPLSSTMYQGDNSTPARSSSEGKQSTPLTPDTIIAEDSAIATEAKKTKKRGLLFGRKTEKTERYVKVTPDTKEDQREQIHNMMQQLLEENAEMTTTLPITRGTGTAAATHDVNEAEHSSPPDEKMKESKRNLNADFTQEDDDNDDYDPLDKENKKFMNRFRTSWRKGSNNRHNNNNMEQKLMPQKLIEQQQKNKAGTTSPVPKLIDQSDGASVPSLITEMTGQSNLKRMKSTEGGISNQKQSVASIPKSGNKEAAVTTTSQMQSFFGPPDSFSRQPRQELTISEKFLNLLSCIGHDDTTTFSDNNGYFGRIKCLDSLCSPLMMGGEKDALRLAREEEDKFVIQFMNELTKHGIKLIYHKPPPPSNGTNITDSTSDWTQITVKMFLRPGSCHDVIQHPKLAWATLPVASRTILTGSYDVNHPSADDEEEEWTYQTLTDVYSILGAEDDANTTLGISTNPSSCELDSNRGGGIIGGETFTRETASHTKDNTTATYDETATNDYTTNQSTTSGFFSITAGSTGNVHVFEAPTGSRRDYIVTGLKKLIRRASYQLISGSLNVCAELYGEDNAMPMMSGELPSLVTPTQALSKDIPRV
eukprot:scaffold72655_cov36-Cyclotella_meneghiniana.AAC.1